MADAAYLEYCRELLAGVGPVDIRRMFGGHGIYADGVMFALIAGDTLYLKVDDEVRPAFEEAGAQPFAYTRRRADRPVALSYYSAPEQAMDDPEAMASWAVRALEAARRARPKRRRGV